MTTPDLSNDPTEEEIEQYLESQDATCAACGEDSRMEAGIDDKWYCHRDERSCDMAAKGALGSLQSFAARAARRDEEKR